MPLWFFFFIYICIHINTHMHIQSIHTHVNNIYIFFYIHALTNTYIHSPRHIYTCKMVYIYRLLKKKKKPIWWYMRIHVIYARICIDEHVYVYIYIRNKDLSPTIFVIFLLIKDKEIAKDVLKEGLLLKRYVITLSQ